MNTESRSPRTSERPSTAMRERTNGFAKTSLAVFLVAAMGILSVRASDGEAEREKSFMDENRTAMDAMMAGMTVEAKGDVDRDFVAMMVPHHEGAIAMAKAELRFGRDERLRRIAQEIIVDQLQEITAMKAAVADAGTARPR